MARSVNKKWFIELIEASSLSCQVKIEVADALKDYPDDEPFDVVYDAVLAREAMTENEIIDLLAENFGVEKVDLESVAVPDDAIKMIPREVAQKHVALPISKSGSTLRVAFYDPTNVYAQDDLHFLTGYNVQVALAPKSLIVGAIEDYYAPQDDSEILDSPAEEMEAAFPGAMTMTDDDEDKKHQAEEDGIDIDALERSSKEAPTVRLVNLVLVDAVRRGASEIHIEPYEKQFDIRYRLDGELHAMMRPPLRLKNAIVSRIKIMAAIDIVERRKVQNGKIQSVLGKEKYVTFYVSILPVLFGEKVVLRVYDAKKALPLASDFFLAVDDMEGLKRELARPGIKGIYGPARAGKTSLLQLISSEMSATWGTQNVLAIGDVDVGNFAVGNVNCVQLDPKFGLTGARAMTEACFGQSADVIIMDGLLDSDTAKAAVNAALSGKVVILTMTAGSAVEVRGVMGKLLGDDSRLDLALNLFLGVRLLRRLCPECKAPFADKEILVKSFPPTELPIVEKMRIPVGCYRCNHKGYSGQVGLCEVAKNASGQTIGASMQAKMRLLLEAGTTSLEEVVRQIPV